jgi:O-antigen/teichoic acid export membrane protein
MTPEASRANAVFAGWRILGLRQVMLVALSGGGFVLLAAMLEPADVALFGYAVTATGIAAAVGDLGLGAGLVANADEPERVEASFGLQAAFVVPLTLAAVLIAAVTGAYGLSAAEAALVGSAFVLGALQTLPTALLERRLRFVAVAVIEVAQRAVFVGLAVALAHVYGSGLGIVVGAALAGVVGYSAALTASRWTWRPRLAGAGRSLRGFAVDWWQGRVAAQLNYAVYPLLGGLLFTREEVGLLVWALGVSAIPALLVPPVARVLLPTLARARAREQVDLYARMLRLSLLVALPGAAVLAVLPDRVAGAFGEDWSRAVPLLRLESMTTALGVAMTACVPLLYLSIEPRRAKRIFVLWATSTWALTLALAAPLSFLAPSVAQIVTLCAATVVVDRELARTRNYRLVADLVRPFAAFAIAVAVGLALADKSRSPSAVVIIAVVSTFFVLATGDTLLGYLRRQPLRATAWSRYASTPGAARSNAE